MRGATGEGAESTPIALQPKLLLQPRSLDQFFERAFVSEENQNALDGFDSFLATTPTQSYFLSAGAKADFAKIDSDLKNVWRFAPLACPRFARRSKIVTSHARQLGE